MANRRLAGALATVAAAALVAGCAVRTPSPTPKPAKNPVHIEFWTALSPDGRAGQDLIQMVDQFNRSQTDVFVTATYQGSYSDIEKKATAAIATGTPPAVVQAPDAMVAAFVNRAVALDPLVPATTFADYPAGFLEPLTVGSRHYAFPFTRTVAVLFYNTRLVPQPPQTWAELRKAAADVAEKADAGIALTSDVYGFAPFFLQAGGQWLKDGLPAFAGPEGTAALQFMQDMVQDGSVALPGPGEYASDFLNSGRVGMIIAPSSSLPYLRTQNGDPIAVAQVPAGSAGALTVGGGSNLMILQGIKPAEQQAAAKFLLWLTGKEATLQFAANGSGYVPVRYSVLADPVWQTYVKVNPEFAAISDAVDKVVAQPTVPNWSAVQAQITTAVRAALNEGETPEDALATAQEAAHDLLVK